MHIANDTISNEKRKTQNNTEIVNEQTPILKTIEICKTDLILLWRDTILPVLLIVSLRRMAEMHI